MFKFHALRGISTMLFIIVMSVSQAVMSQSLSNQMDIRVLIDVSGSMKQTDPNNLRIPALQVLTQLLPIGSKAGVWQFANTPKVIVPHGDVNTQWQQKASIAAQQISSIGQFTDIGAALKSASFNAQDQSQGRQLHIILLTDGMVDVSKDDAQNERARSALLKPILQQYINVGARVHTIGLSHKADKATLSAIAQGTDGLFEVAINADQLLDIFLRALDNTVVTQQVPVKRSEQSFLVQPGIDSMTIMVEKNGDENIKLKDGNQRIFGKEQTLSNQQWQSSATHDVIRIQKPIPGKWVLISDTATLKRINVVGQLQILLQQSHQNIKVGQRSYIDVQLADEKGKLLSAEQLQGFKLEVTMDNDNQQVFQQQQVFLADVKTRMHLPVLNEPGLYNLTISVVNGQFIRTINRSLRVHPLIALSAADGTDAGQQNTMTMPVTKEVAVIVGQSANLMSQSEAMVVSKETASPALQALMVEQVASETAEVGIVAAVAKELNITAIQLSKQTTSEQTTSEQTTSEQVLIEAPVTTELVDVTAEPETAASQIADLVKKLKDKIISQGTSTQNTPNAVAKASSNNAQASEAEGGLSDQLRWLVVGGAVVVLLLLLVILRRTSKPSTTNSKKHDQT